MRQGAVYVVQAHQLAGARASIDADGDIRVVHSHTHRALRLQEQRIAHEHGGKRDDEKLLHCAPFPDESRRFDNSQEKTALREGGSIKQACAYSFSSILAQVSRKVAVRLNTSAPGRLS